MRLRLRSIGSKETQKIEAPDPCSLTQLRQIISQSLPNSPSPYAIRLSLNRKDELQSDGDESVQSLGVASGDLIFFYLEQEAAGGMSSNPLPEPESRVSEGLTSFNSNENREIVGCEGGKTVEIVESEEKMEIDGGSDDADGLSGEIVDKPSFSVPGFLRKVFAEEMTDDGGRGHKLIVIAIHAVMLESGFVGFDKNTKMVVSGFQFRNRWPSGLFRLSLCYALPEGVGGDNGEATKTVVLKFQNLGNLINIYGTLDDDSGKGGTHVVQLNEDKLVPFLNVIWADCCYSEHMSDGTNESCSVLSPEKEVFAFWRDVKDNLALPLLIDLCEEAGLELPPCFIRLPTDLKLKILESMAGVDLARVSCTCSELRYLGSNNDLWKLKFNEEFVATQKKEEHRTWKMAYASAWSRRKYAATMSDDQARLSPQIYYRSSRWSRNPFMIPRIPRIIGGDYDIGPPHGYPVFGDGSRSRSRAIIQPRNFSPPCNLGSGGGGRFV